MVSNFKMSTNIENLETIERSVVSPEEDVPIQFEDRKN